MPLWLADSMDFLKGPLPECPSDRKCLEWVHRYLKDCVCSSRDVISFVIGLLSVLSWGVAEVPQIITHSKNKSTEGLSLAFLMTWVIGDLFNLVGCYLEPATLPTQFYMALLYTITTVILVGQVLYYDYVCKRLKYKDDALEDTFMPQKEVEGELVSRPLFVLERPDEQQGTPMSSQPIVGIGVPTPRKREWYYTSARSLASSHTPTAGSILSGSRGSGGHGTSSLLKFRTHPVNVPRSAPIADRIPALVQTAASSFLCIGGLGLRIGSSYRGRGSFPGGESQYRAKFLVAGARKLSQELSDSNGESFLVNLQEFGSQSALGELCGWIMTAIYMGGRIPQIWLNMRRGTVEGLNPLMFLFAFIGNTTYVGSILVRSLDWARIRPNLPWLVDAGACVLLDFFILCQFYYYRRKARDNDGDYEILK